MEFNIDSISTGHQITGYGEDYITIDGTPHHSSVIISVNCVIVPWVVTRLTMLTAKEITPLFELKPEIILLGTGRRHHQVHPELFQHCLFQGIGLEVMSTASACRTYQLLQADKRHVVAGLIID